VISNKFFELKNLLLITYYILLITVFLTIYNMLYAIYEKEIASSGIQVMLSATLAMTEKDGFPFAWE
jgi:hypothetical protein